MNHICRFTNKNNGEVSQARDETSPTTFQISYILWGMDEKASVPGFSFSAWHTVEGRKKEGWVVHYSESFWMDWNGPSDQGWWNRDSSPNNSLGLVTGSCYGSGSEPETFFPLPMSSSQSGKCKRKIRCRVHFPRDVPLGFTMHGSVTAQSLAWPRLNSWQHQQTGVGKMSGEVFPGSVDSIGRGKDSLIQ